MRCHGLGDRSLWLDEIMGVEGLADDANGPVYHALLAMSKAVAPSELGYRLPFALAGAASVGVMALATAEIAGPAVGVTAGVLLAMSPLHVYLSRQARPYALQLLAFVLGGLALARRRRPGSSRSWDVLLASTVIGLLMLSANGAFYAGLLAAGLIVAPRSGRSSLRGRFLVACALLMLQAAVVLLFYRTALSRHFVPAEAPGTATLIASLIQALLAGHRDGDPVTWVLLPWSCLIAMGALLLCLHRPRVGASVCAASLLGFLGPLIAIGHFGHGIGLCVRYLLPSLPPLLVLAASGLVLLPSALRPAHRAARPMAIALACGVALLLAPEVGRARRDRADWRGVAVLLKDRARPSDLVLTSNDWALICLRYYMQRVGGSIVLQSAEESVDKAKNLLKGHRLALLVTGGYHRTTEIRSFMDRFPALLREPIEGIAVYAYPDLATYLGARGSPEEIADDARTFWKRLGGRLDFGPASDRFLASGFSVAEVDSRGHPFRWAMGTSCGLYVPAHPPFPTRLRVNLRALPLLEGRQRATVTVNGVASGTFPLQGWTDLDVDVGTAPWREGANLVGFTFDEARSPGGADRRELSAVFRALLIESAHGVRGQYPSRPQATFTP